MLIVVCPAAHLAEVAAEVRPELVIALHAPDRPPPTLPDRGCLAFAFHDIAAPRAGLVAPGAEAVAAILAAGGSIHGPILVSCELGISRSPAIAYALACQSAPHGAEADLAAALREASPCATPNPLIVALADALLGRSGRMVAAIAAIGRGADYAPSRGFALTAAREPSR